MDSRYFNLFDNGWLTSVETVFCIFFPCSYPVLFQLVRLSDIDLLPFYFLDLDRLDLLEITRSTLDWKLMWML